MIEGGGDSFEYKLSTCNVKYANRIVKYLFLLELPDCQMKSANVFQLIFAIVSWLASLKHVELFFVPYPS